MSDQATADTPAVASQAAPDDAVTLTHAIAAMDSGFVAAIEQIADDPAQCVTRLQHFDASGALIDTLAERTVSAALLDLGVSPVARMQGTDPALTAFNDGDVAEIFPLAGDVDKIAAAFADVPIGNVAQAASSGAYVAVLAENRDEEGAAVQSLHAVKTSLKAPKMTPLGLSPLTLDGARQITQIAVWQDAVYAAVADAIAGCDVYRFDLKAKSPEAEVVFAQGGMRFALDAAVTCFLPTDDALLLGTAAMAHTDPKQGNWGGELIALRADGTWDVVFGQQRFTPDGLRLSLSGQGAGFGSVDNTALKALAHVPGSKGGRVIAALQMFMGEPVARREDARIEMLDYYGQVRFLASSASDGLSQWEEIAVDLPEDSGAITALNVVGDTLIVGHERMGPDQPPFTLVPLP